ncbi:MAG TPA: hypothetical protein VE650_16130 [Acetobacteraceae bacterium]|nr:hypothetical protein [Acetobacteraceae bacterium]
MTAATLAPTRHAVLRGILYMLLGRCLFAANDSLGEAPVATYSVGQLLASERIRRRPSP